MKKARYLFIGILIVTLISCGQSVSFMQYTEMKYNSTTSVEVFRIKPIDRKYTEIGELSLRITNDLILNNEDDAVLRLKEKAKEIGADAIIILGEETNRISKDNYYKYVKAIAIKYI